MFLNRELFNTPKWLIDQNLISQAGVDPVGSIRNIQGTTLSRLQNAGTLMKLINAEATSTAATYKAFDLFRDLRSGVWSELNTHANIDLHRRNLQKLYIENLANLLKAPASSPATGMQAMSPRPIDPTLCDISRVARAELVSLKSAVSKAIPSAKGMSKYHLQDVLVRINNTLKEDS